MSAQTMVQKIIGLHAFESIKNHESLEVYLELKEEVIAQMVFWPGGIAEIDRFLALHDSAHTTLTQLIKDEHYNLDWLNT